MPVRVTKQQTSDSPNASDDKQIGLEALQDGRWLEAVIYLERAVDADPSDASAMNSLALAHSGSGNSKLARAVLAQAAKAAPDYVETYTNFAALLAKDGRALEAADNACRAVELDPTNDEAVRILRETRALVLSQTPAGKKKKKKARPANGPSQADIDLRLRRINSALARAAAAAPIEAGKPTISLCMIVRDEEAFLDECLESVSGVVDEIVVLDTGSKDNTVAIANAHNARVFSKDWTESFADARNASLDHATGDWILMLDADERLDESSKRTVIRVVSKPAADGYELLIKNYRSGGPNPDFYAHRACRLFRNKPQHRYRGRVHEMIGPSITDCGGKIGRIDAVIHHHGYQPDVIEQRDKSATYIRLLKADLEEEPHNAYCLYNLGTTYWACGDYEEAVAQYDEAARYIRPHSEYAAAIFYSFANALCVTGRAEPALATVTRAENLGIRHPQLCFCKGNALLLLKRYDKAIEEFQSAIRDGSSGLWEGDAGAYGYKANYGIASAYAGLGDFRKAAEFCEKTLVQKPDDIQSRLLLGAALSHLGKWQAAEQSYLQCIEMKENLAAAHAGLARTYAAQGRVGESLSSFVKALEIDPAHAELYFQAAELLCSCGDYANAASIYQNGLQSSPDSADGFFGLGNCYLRMGAHEAAAMAYRQVLAISPGHAEAGANLSKVELILAA